MSIKLRWVQRFENLERAFAKLQEALSVPSHDLTDLEQEGLVQRFEYTYELAWKTLKDYLGHAGVVIEPVTPRAVLREAFALKLIMDGDVWMDMLEKRNLTSHIYNEETFRAVVSAIESRYLKSIEQVVTLLRARLRDG